MQQEAMTFETTIMQAVRLNYLLYLPPDYGKDETSTFPLILFLHGAGERGCDLERVKIHGIAKVVEQRPLPFICVSPQCPEQTWWADWAPALKSLLDEVCETYRVDTSRLYLTGLSMGGYGTWVMAAMYPRLFAAIAPICGGGPWFYGFPERAQTLKHLPTWVFHGAKDNIVKPQESRLLVRHLKRVHGNVRYTEYPNANHDSWSTTYDNPELYEWLLQQRAG